MTDTHICGNLNLYAPTIVTHQNYTRAPILGYTQTYGTYGSVQSNPYDPYLQRFNDMIGSGIANFSNTLKFIDDEAIESAVATYTFPEYVQGTFAGVYLFSLSYEASVTDGSVSLVQLNISLSMNRGAETVNHSEQFSFHSSNTKINKTFTSVVVIELTDEIIFMELYTQFVDSSQTNEAHITLKNNFYKFIKIA